MTLREKGSRVMTDLLTPDEARKLQGDTFSIFGDEERIKTRWLCRDYLTLWERNKDLKAALAAANSDLVGRWVCPCGVSVRDGDSHTCHGTAKVRKHLSGTTRTFLDYP